MPHGVRSPRRYVTALALTGIVAGLVSAGSITAARAEPPLSNQIAAAQRQLAELNAKVDVAVEHYNQATLTLVTARATASAAQQQVAVSSRRVTALHKQLGTIAATAYMNGGTGDLLPLMASGTATDYLDAAATLDVVSQSQSDLLDQVQSATDDLTQRQIAARQAADAASRAAAAAAKQRAGVQKEVAQQEALISKLRVEQRRLEAIAAAKAAAARAAARRAAFARAARERAAALAAEQAAEAAAAAARQQAAAVLPGYGASGPQPTYNGPTSTRAQIAVEWAYKELGKP